MSDTRKGERLPTHKLISVHIPVAIIAEYHYYAAQDSRTPSDYLRQAIRTYNETSRRKYGAPDHEQLKEITDRVINGGRIGTPNMEPRPINNDRGTTGTNVSIRPADAS